MMLPLDQFAVTALLLVMVVGGMRLFYGAWPWEASKTWYRTRQAVDYVEALRGEKKRDPALQRVGDVVDTSSDSFDRGLLVDDNSPPEGMPPPGAPAVAKEMAASLQKSTKKLPSVRLRSLKSSRRRQPVQVAETALLTTGGSDGGDQAEQ
jgi:uncharacterized protein YjeT (DUF2065 family)